MRPMFLLFHECFYLYKVLNVSELVWIPGRDATRLPSWGPKLPHL